MTAPAINEPAPEFALPASGGGTVALSQLRGKVVVLYFYPKDDTPGCTQEGQDFRDQYAAFEAIGALVLGVSRDSLKSHDNFRDKFGFPFPLLSDADEAVCQAYDVIKMKNMYGKQVRGIERSTFLIDRDGVLRREWRKVKVQGHAAEVLDAAGNL